MIPTTDINKELDNLQREIDVAKKSAATAEGRIQESMKRLKDDFDLKSIDEAKKEIAGIEGKMNSLEKDIQERFVSLKETYSW